MWTDLFEVGCVHFIYEYIYRFKNKSFIDYLVQKLCYTDAIWIYCNINIYLKYNPVTKIERVIIWFYRYVPLQVDLLLRKLIITKPLRNFRFISTETCLWLTYTANVITSRFVLVFEKIIANTFIKSILLDVYNFRVHVRCSYLFTEHCQNSKALTFHFS